jgi:hypothetical protein
MRKMCRDGTVTDAQQMKPELPINPYQSPKSAVDGPRDGQQPKLVRRPASVVWTILVLGFYSFITLWKFSQAIASRGLWEVIQTQTPWNLPVLILVSFAVSLLGRGKLSHRVISVIIGWNIIRGVVFSFSNWMKVTDKWQYLLDNSLTFIIAAPLLYLFFRYIFGQPARSYYGYTPNSGHTIGK